MSKLNAFTEAYRACKFSTEVGKDADLGIFGATVLASEGPLTTVKVELRRSCVPAMVVSLFELIELGEWAKGLVE